MVLFSTSFFAKYLRVVEDGPGRGHLCHTDTFLVFFCFVFLQLFPKLPSGMAKSVV